MVLEDTSLLDMFELWWGSHWETNASPSKPPTLVLLFAKIQSDLSTVISIGLEGLALKGGILLSRQSNTLLWTLNFPYVVIPNAEPYYASFSVLL